MRIRLVSALPLDELQAAAFQQAPIAEIPAGDEMVLVNNNTSLTKVNAYRRGVDQTLANTLNVNPANPVRSANTTVYCQNLINTGIPILQQEMGLTQNAASPMPAVANSLFTFLANRLNATLGAGGLNCVGLLNIQNPVTLTMDGNGVVTAATLTTTPAAANSGNSGTPTTSPTTGVGTTPAAGTSTTPTVPLPIQQGLQTQQMVSLLRQFQLLPALLQVQRVVQRLRRLHLQQALLLRQPRVLVVDIPVEHIEKGNRNAKNDSPRWMGF